MIRASALSLRFRSGRLGLATVDFAADAGEIVAVLGPNGSGKTTLLRILARLVRPTSGTIHGPGHGEPRRIGWAPDTAVHFDELSAFANARFFARAHGAGDDAIRPLLREFGLETDADRPVAEHSFGMRRKLMLVEALAHSPGLLLMDEPTVGLDPDSILALTAALKRHALAGGTAILATNDLSATAIASRIVFLHRGRKIADGTRAGLLAQIGAGTRIDFVLDQLPEALPAMDGTAFERTAGGLVAVTSGVERLPRILEVLARAGHHVREIRIREPDLRDVFRALAGEELGPATGPATGEPPGHGREPGQLPYDRRRRVPWRRE